MAKNANLRRYRVPGTDGHPKPVLTFVDAWAWLLGQKGAVPDQARAFSARTVARAAAGDRTLIAEMQARADTLDPNVRAVLMGGVCTDDASIPTVEEVLASAPEQTQTLPPYAERFRVDQGHQSAPKQLTFVEAEDRLVEARVCSGLLASPLGAEIIVVMQESGLLAALKCVREVTAIYMASKKTMMEIDTHKAESDARIANGEKDIAAKIVRDDKKEKEKTAAKIQADKEAAAAKIQRETEAAAAKLENDKAETVTVALDKAARITKEMETERMKQETETEKARMTQETERFKVKNAADLLRLEIRKLELQTTLAVLRCNGKGAEEGGDVGGPNDGAQPPTY